MTTEKAAKCYSLGNCGKDDYEHIRDAFIAGAEFAQRWISVEDELPEEGVSVLLKGYFKRFSRGDMDKEQIKTGMLLGGNFFTQCGVRCLFCPIL